jgi:hypothetical protein
MYTQPKYDINEYIQLLDLTYQVIQSLQGKPSPDSRWPDCQHLATKLFFHAATVYRLRQGTIVPLLSSSGTNFFDFASVTVITRAILETYLTLFEVFFKPTSDDEFEFRHAIWKLSGFIIRENYVPHDPGLQSQFASAQKEIQDLKVRIQKTAFYASMRAREQKEALKGKRKRDWPSVAKSAGFGEQTLRRMYAYYSGYVHADGLSGSQIVTARTAQEQIYYIEINIRTIMIVLSKLIIEYARKFTEAKIVCDKNPETYHLALILAEAESRLP